MSRDWTQQEFGITGKEPDSYEQLKSELAKVKQQLAIAVEALEIYANKDNWDNHYEVDWCIEIKKFDEGECVNGEFYADEALKQIKELEND